MPGMHENSRHFARRILPAALAAAPIHSGKVAFGRGFRLSLLKPRQSSLFQALLSVTYTAVASGLSGNVEKEFAKAGQPDCNLLILRGIVIKAGFIVDDKFNGSCCFRHFPE